MSKKTPKSANDGRDDWARVMAKHDSRGDEEMWRGVMDLAASLVEASEEHSDRSRRAGKASAEARGGENSKKALILAEAAGYDGPPEAKANTIISRIKRKHGVTVTDRYVREVLK